MKKVYTLCLDSYGMETSLQQQQKMMRRLHDEYHRLQQAQWYQTGAERERIQNRLYILRINMMYLARNIRHEAKKPHHCNSTMLE